MKRKLVRPHTEGRTSNTHAVTDASDRLEVDTDEPADPDGLGEEVTDTVGTPRAALRTLTKAEREEQDVSHVSWEEGDWRDTT